MPRSLLSDLNIGEIAFCRSGVNPGAKIVLYKKRPDPVTIQKEEVRSFTDHLEAGRAMEIDGAIDRRLYALLDTTTEIMRADVTDREGLILQAVNAYAETMERDVPELFAGRLAKQLVELAAEGEAERSSVAVLIKSELQGAGLLPVASNGGDVMDFLKALTERGQAALSYVLGDRDPAEIFKGVTEDAGTVIVGLLNKAAEWGDRIDGLEADLEKARKPAADPNSLESILKSIDDPGTRAYVETQAGAVSTLTKQFTDLQKATRRGEIATIVKAMECLPNANDALVIVLEKADAVPGLMDDLQPILEAANAQARLGKALADLGIDTLPGDGNAATPEEADQALIGKATELRKARPELSVEQSYTEACEQNPTLYQATRQVRTVQ